jgi:guanosine-3',5'-bis(diphosphate) 3'-pyrophosphohydrolase
MFDFTPIHSLDELLQSRTDLSADEAQLLRAAFDLIVELHSNVLRKSGETWIDHCLNTAVYTSRIGLDANSIAAALLHDTLETGKVTIDELAKKTNDEVSLLVDGLTNIRRASAKLNNVEVNLEAFRRLIIRATDDIRILIIRLAEKIDGINNVENLPEDLRINVARRAENVYAVLCEYLNLYEWQRCLQDGAFRILHPQSHAIMEQTLETNSVIYEETLSAASRDFKTLFESHNLPIAQVNYRRKGLQSAFRKVMRKHNLHEADLNNSYILKLNDLLGMRIITDSVENCYIALGLLHANYEYDPDEFDDYIVQPKPSGYRSIHTMVKYKEYWLDIQIRTEAMHELNEYGPASHVAYKLGGNERDYGWLKELTLWQADKNDPQQQYRIKAFAESKFLFTPKGKVVRLSKDATVLDFAFQVHTDVGYHYRGALVNDKMVKIDYEPTTGDVVEIITGKHPSVNLGWLKCVKMNSSQARIRRWARHNQQLEPTI